MYTGGMDHPQCEGQVAGLYYKDGLETFRSLTTHRFFCDVLNIDVITFANLNLSVIKVTDCNMLSRTIFFKANKSVILQRMPRFFRKSNCMNS